MNQLIGILILLTACIAWYLVYRVIQTASPVREGTIVWNGKTIRYRLLTKDKGETWVALDENSNELGPIQKVYPEFWKEIWPAD